MPPRQNGGASQPRTFTPTSMLINTAMTGRPGLRFMPASVQVNTSKVLRMEALE